MPPDFDVFIYANLQIELKYLKFKCWVFKCWVFKCWRVANRLLATSGSTGAPAEPRGLVVFWVVGCVARRSWLDNLRLSPRG